MAALLGVSTRAVQSYEQGWRSPPPSLEKLVGLMLLLDWRRDHPDAAPCWVATGCTDETQKRCPVKRLNAGDLCWLTPGACCRETCGSDWESTMARCSDCPAMTRWLRP